MSQTQQIRKKPVAPVQALIMRRVALVLVLIFISFAAIGLKVWRDSIYTQLNQLHRSELAERANLVIAQLQKVQRDVQRVSGGDSAIAFATDIQFIESQNSVEVPSQDQLLRDFLRLINESGGQYQAIRFVTNEGAVWSEVVNSEGITVPNYGRRNGEFSKNAAFNQARSTNQPQLSPVVAQRTVTGRTNVFFQMFVPVTTQDRASTLGMVELDFQAKPILDTILTAPSADGERWVLIDENTQYLADNQSPEAYLTSATTNANRDVSVREPELGKLLNDTPGSVELIEYNSQALSTYAIQLGSIPASPWHLVLVDAQTPAGRGLYTGTAAIIIGCLVAGLLVLWLVNRIVANYLRNLSAASELAAQLAEGHIDDTLVSFGEAGEISGMANSFKLISSRLKSLTEDMTTQLGRQQRSLQTALHINRETATLSDLDELVNRAIQMICKEFDVSHAQVFLMDDIGLNAVLAYSGGDIGQQLLEQGYTVPVGSLSIIGAVARSGGPSVVNDTRSSGAFARHPLLPDTLSEVALPLLAGSKVIGALDIHSASPNAFPEDVVSVLQLLADQLAAAIQNARLMVEAQTRVEQAEKLNRQLTRTAWEETEDEAGLQGAYHYNLMEVKPVKDEEESVIAAISAPISIRGEVIGTIAAAAQEDQPFTQGDQVILRQVAERVGLAIEGARLFKETQSSLAVTSKLYELSQRLNQANALEDVIQAVLRAVINDASGGQVWLFDEETLEDGTPEWMEVSADQSPVKANSLMNMRVHIPDSPFLSSLRSNQIALITDTARDTRLDDTVRRVFQIAQARAAVIMPFSVRGVWRGLITVEFNEPREFSESEGRIYNALNDQIGVAIDNRLLVQQTELTLDQIERLYSASRIINTAYKLSELVRAAAAATKDPNLNFELGLLEGQLDKTGWPTRVRKIARTENGQVVDIEESLPLNVGPGSPMRHREPEVLITPDGSPKFTAMFPLFSINNPIAILYLVSEAARELTAEDYETYHALAGQMSTVLENQRLLEQTELALDETRQLYAASRAIASAQDTNAVYHAATEYLSRPLPTLSRLSIVLAGPTPSLEPSYFDYVHVWERKPDGLVPVGLRQNSDAAPFQSLNPTEPTYLPKLADALGDQPRLRTALERGGAASVLVMPLRSQRTWFGVLVCESKHTEAFEEQYIRFTQAVSDQLAIALENRMLFEEAQQEAQRALALAEVGQLATRVGSEFESNINEVFSRVALPARYDRWLLMQMDGTDTGTLRITTSQSDAPMLSSGDLLDVQTGAHSIADAVRDDLLIVVNDPHTYPAFVGQSQQVIEGVGRHIVTPIRVGGETVGALLVGRRLDGAALDERDVQLVTTLAAQVSVAVENRRLFQAVEQEREYLSSILNTMPTGILVLDAQTYKPIQANAQAETLLGRPVMYDKPFDVADYNLYRTGTNVFYPMDELPIFVVSQGDGLDFSDDIAAIHEDGSQTDLLLNAAPIHDSRGNVTAIVAAFQDISNLRGLENALQNNLRETIALYEATRTLSEAREIDDALDATIMQLALLEPADAYIVLLDEVTGALNPVRALFSMDTFQIPNEVFDSGLLMISDLTSDDAPLPAEAVHSLREQGILSVTSAPMRARDNLLGWLVVLYDRTSDFTPEDERFLTTVCDNAAVVIDNRNLFERTELAYQEATTLYETSRALTNASAPDDILKVVIDHLKPAYVTQVFMALPLEGSENDLAMMQVAANWQRDPETGINLLGVALTADQFPAWRQVTSPSLLTIDDVYADESLDEMERIGLESIEARSMVVLPLRAGTRRIGVIWMVSNEPHTHNEREMRIYRSFIEQASLSMEAARLLKQTERRARQLATSAEVSQIASSILDLNQLLPRLVNLIRDAFGYDHVQIFLMDAGDEYAELRASTGEAGQKLLAIKHKLAKSSQSVIGQVTATGQPQLALDTADARFVHKPNPYLPLTRSEMALPIIVKGRVIGALDVQSNQSNAFNEEDVSVLTTLAAQISVAIDNANLFEQSERRAQDMSFLFKVTAAAALPGQTLGVSLKTVAEMVRGDLDALDAAIYLAERYEDPDGNTHTLLRVTALAGSEQPLSEISEVYMENDTGLLATAARSAEARIINIEQESRYVPIMSQARSAVVVPLLTGGELIGLVALEADRPNAFTDDTVQILRTLTSTLSAIVQNARLLEQVQSQNDQLRELDRLKSDFLANMSHELRTPLNSIIGFSRVILKGIDGPLTEMQEQDLSTIYNSGQHLLGLINDILDQAKINSGKMELQKDYFEVKAVVEGVRSIGIGLVKDKPIDMRLEIASGLPKAFGDEFRTRQVLLNLVSNASKFTQKGSVTIRAYPDQHPETGRDMVRVDVIDTGIGIAEKDMPLLFEAFRQVDSSLTRTVGGTGLGLPIAKSLIEMQGGMMVVASEVNVGSTFSILIPTEPPDPADEQAGDAPAQKPKTGKLNTTGSLVKPKTGQLAQTGPLNGKHAEPAAENHSGDTVETNGARDKRATMPMPAMPTKRQILLIEDNPDMVDQFRRNLQREGFDIFSASIPLEAEAMASGLRPTLIIMDVDFSRGAGWDILRRLKERDDTQDIPVIVVTLNGDEARAIQMGAFRFVQRPYMPEQLVEVVHEAERDSQTERILIIDDQPESTRLIKEVLDENGQYRVFAAHSGAEGVSMVARTRPNLVILDLRMPEMDGFAVLEELQANPETATIPIMVVTADTLDATEQSRLADLSVMYKADLSQENYRDFIDGVRTYLSGSTSSES
jgi:GAF domain-containing protein/DNA-binding response OmpR family regulator